MSSIQDRLEAYHNSSLDKIEKDLSLTSSLSELPRLSTGLLVLDVILGGGLVAGMYTFSGHEASGKSTAGMTIMNSAKNSKIPIKRYHDPEGAVDPDYTAGIFRVGSLEEIFGERDEKTGKWNRIPVIRYSDNNIFETIVKSIKRTLKSLPDKYYRPEKKQWYLVFDRTRDDQAMMKELKLTSDKKLYTQTGRYWCPVDDGTPQAIFLVDSYPTMVPEDVDEGDDEGQGLGLLARKFAEKMPAVRGLLRRKAAILVGINQLRDRPMVRYGSPEYEPCGNFLKLASDCRCILRAVVPPKEGSWPRDAENGGICVEPSVESKGATDRYAFKKISNIKNKHGRPFRKGLARVWIADSDGEARGFDPVFDTWEFLDTLGMIEGSRKEFVINGIPELDDIKFNWDTFKLYVLAEVKHSKKMLKRFRAKAAVGKKFKFKLRSHCFRMIRNKKAFEMLIQAQKSAVQGGDEDDIEDMDEE